MANETKRVLMTGAAGQIGSELAEALRKKYGRDNVLVIDLVRPPASLAEAGPFELADGPTGPRKQSQERVSGVGAAEGADHDGCET